MCITKMVRTPTKIHFVQVRMVGYDPHVKELPQLTYGLAGALSGFITRAISQPLDVLKIRLQVYLVYTLRFYIN
jgi:Mitochondrial carrier protein